MIRDTFAIIGIAATITVTIAVLIAWSVASDFRARNRSNHRNRNVSKDERTRGSFQHDGEQ